MRLTRRLSSGSTLRSPVAFLDVELLTGVAISGAALEAVTTGNIMYFGFGSRARADPLRIDSKTPYATTVAMFRLDILQFGPDSTDEGPETNT